MHMQKGWKQVQLSFKSNVMYRGVCTCLLLCINNLKSIQCCLAYDTGTGTAQRVYSIQPTF